MRTNLIASMQYHNNDLGVSSFKLSSFSLSRGDDSVRLVWFIYSGPRTTRGARTNSFFATMTPHHKWKSGSTLFSLTIGWVGLWHTLLIHKSLTVIILKGTPMEVIDRSHILERDKYPVRTKIAEGQGEKMTLRARNLKQNHVSRSNKRAPRMHASRPCVIDSRLTHVRIGAMIHKYLQFEHVSH